MDEHDQMCPWQKSAWVGAKGTECPHCRLIARVREDERAKVLREQRDEDGMVMFVIERRDA